jgi:hypothetical protein
MARKRQRGQRVQRENPDLQHLRTCLELRAVGELCSISNPDHAVRVLFGNVIHADQRGQLDGRAYLLEALAHRRAGGIFVIVDEAAG